MLSTQSFYSKFITTLWDQSLLISVLSTNHETSNISHTFEGNIIVDHSGVVGAAPVGAAATTYSFSTKNTQLQT